MRRAVVWVLTMIVATRSAPARDHASAPPLPPPSGTIVDVSTVAGLQQAVASLASNTTIRIAAGTYDLTSTLWVRPSGSAISNVAIRGATGDPDDVVIRGRGMANANHGNVPHGIHVGNVSGILIADLTIRDVYYHPIQLAGELGCAAPRVYNCKLIDAGEQFVKGSLATYGEGVDDGIVEYTLFEYTTTCRDWYTNGIDILGGRNWAIRHNLFRRIREHPSAGRRCGPAVLMWRGSANTVVEGNTFIDCSIGIGLGWEDVATDDAHVGGVVRNNFFYRSASATGDVGIAIWDSPGTKVLHNTVLLSGTYPNAIEYRFDTTGATICYNLADSQVVDRGGGTAGNTVSGNVTSAQSSWFANAAAGDLRLSVSAPGSVVDAAAAHADVFDDFDGAARGASGAPDIGADERGSATGDTTAPVVTIASPTSGGAHATTSATISLSGTASDNVDVAAATWSNDRGGSGACVGTISWSTPGIALQVGQNVITVSATDAAGNVGTDTLVVTRSVSTGGTAGVTTGGGTGSTGGTRGSGGGGGGCGAAPGAPGGASISAPALVGAAALLLGLRTRGRRRR